MPTPSFGRVWATSDIIDAIRTVGLEGVIARYPPPSKNIHYPAPDAFLEFRWLVVRYASSASDRPLLRPIGLISHFGGSGQNGALPLTKKWGGSGHEFTEFAESYG